MKADEREKLTDAIAGDMKSCRQDIKERMVKLFSQCDPEYGAKIAAKMGMTSVTAKLWFSLFKQLLYSIQDYIFK